VGHSLVSEPSRLGEPLDLFVVAGGEKAGVVLPLIRVFAVFAVGRGPIAKVAPNGCLDVLPRFGGDFPNPFVALLQKTALLRKAYGRPRRFGGVGGPAKLSDPY
jgi:hypothetical protein